VGLTALSAPTGSAAARPDPQAVTTADDSLVIGAVGDMACDPADSKFFAGAGNANKCAQNRVSTLMLADTGLTAILGLGDYQYDCGDPADYAVSYNPTWGRLDPLMTPIAGNHEYKTGQDLYGAACPSTNSTAASYFAHFGAAAHATTGGHFSFDLGSWHLIALNSNCGKTGVGGCGAKSPQTKWLQQDLAATTQPCLAAFWHQPLFTAAKFGGSAYRPWWNLLYAAHADVVLNGHVHNYQRYAALEPEGSSDANGITQYTVGTGGEGFHVLVTSVHPQPVVYLRRFGYLRMTLAPSGWSAEFVDSTGAVADSSSGSCHA
jgi:acid phosphatase type 7